MQNPYKSDYKRKLYNLGMNDRLDGNERQVISDTPKYQYCYDRGYRNAGKP